MIDPKNITNYHMTDYELQENALFWILTAGKTASTAAKALDKILRDPDKSRYLPFERIKRIGKKRLSPNLKKAGMGCYNQKSRSFLELIKSDIDLRNCSAEELESIYGIGMKTSRCFIIHSRKGAQYAGLDTHVLKYLRDQGHEVPEVTPQSKKQYSRLEGLFLDHAKDSGMPVAKFDLEIWKQYSR